MPAQRVLPDRPHTRSASRSNPQRMSVASLASQIRTRAICPTPSSKVRTLGSPSLRTLYRRHQLPHLLRIKSLPHPQAPPSLEQNFHARIARRPRSAPV
jgi:hypothetical protein